MSIETTIHINIDVLERLSGAASLTGESKRNIVSLLMRRISDEYEKIATPWKRIAYQKRNEKRKWKRLHLTLIPDEYEFFQDLRKGCKMSVSRLVAYGVEKYLDEVIADFLKGTDNYRYSNYTMSYFIHRGVVCLIYYWGIPEKPLSACFHAALMHDQVPASGG